MIINLTIHPASPEQISDGVVDLPPRARALLLDAYKFKKLPSLGAIRIRCVIISMLAIFNELGVDGEDDPSPSAALIGGEPWMVEMLHAELLSVNIPVVYSFMGYGAVVCVRADGTTIDTVRHMHLGFVV